MRILYCADFTDTAAYSFDKASRFLKEGCKIDIISVIETGFLTVHGNHYLEVYKENKIENLEKVKLKLESKKLHVENIFYPQGDAAEEILKQLKAKEYSLVITGSGVKKLFGKWLGRVSRKIANKSYVPVFIARQNEKITALSEKKKILFAVDGNENSYNAIRKVTEILNIINSEIEIIYVKPGRENLPVEIIADGDWLQSLLIKQQELAEEIIEHALNIAEEKGINVTSKTILEGSPIEEILNYIEKSPKDLIIMGSRGREGISSMLLGSVSKGILNNSHSPALIIPSKKVLK